jgi:hypothetical protein
MELNLGDSRILARVRVELTRAEIHALRWHLLQTITYKHERSTFDAGKGTGSFEFVVKED